MTEKIIQVINTLWYPRFQTLKILQGPNGAELKNGYMTQLTGTNILHIK